MDNMLLNLSPAPYIPFQTPPTWAGTVLFVGLMVLCLGCLVAIAWNLNPGFFLVPAFLLLLPAVAVLAVHWYKADTVYRADVLQVVKTRWPVENVRNITWASDVDRPTVEGPTTVDPTATATFFAELKGETVKCSVSNSKDAGLSLRCSPLAPLVPTDPQSTLPKG